MGLNLSMDDSLAALRGHAFAADRTVDATARDMVHRDLPVNTLGITSEPSPKPAE
jgi:hypothetical protein